MPLPSGRAIRLAPSGEKENPMQRLTVLFVFALATCVAAGASHAEGWGGLKGRFVYDGEAPAPLPLKIDKDQEVCGKHKLVDESLVVGSTGGLKNIVVYLHVNQGETTPPIHPDLVKAKAQPVVFDNLNCRFEPRVALLQTDQTIMLTNSDPVAHNTKINPIDPANTPINPLIPAGGKLPQKFSAPERLPAQAGCSIHPWMVGWIVIKDHPYMAVTDENGEFEIKNIPAGTWTFQFWQEKAGYLDKVTMNGKAVEWKRGRVDLDIKNEAVLNLGEVKIAPAAFQK
jgi:hypothetical protein